MGPPSRQVENDSHHRSMNGGGRCKTCISITKWLPVVFIVAIIMWSYYAFVIQLCIFTMRETWLQILTLLVYHVVLILFLWSYWQTIFVGSGRVPRKFKIPPAEVDKMDRAASMEDISRILERIVRSQELPVQTRANIDQIRYCEKCQIIKPDRCHHCSVCGSCILKMDHHCPWVNNCVCFDNYKFFILFLGYAFFYCFVIFCFTLPYFIEFWRGDWQGSLGGRFHILFVFFVAAMFAVSLCSLLCYHLFLVTKNRSTLESFRAPLFSTGPDKRGFDLGAYNNWVEIFGEDKVKWFFPVFTSLGDGISYPTRHHLSYNVSGNYNSIDTTSSTQASASGSPDHFVEVKVEARNENDQNSNGNGGFGSQHPEPESQPGNETPLVYF